MVHFSLHHVVAAMCKSLLLVRRVFPHVRWHRCCSQMCHGLLNSCVGGSSVLSRCATPQCRNGNSAWLEDSRSTKVVQEDWTGFSLALLACASVGSGTWMGTLWTTDVNPDRRCLAIQSFLEHPCPCSGNRKRFYLLEGSGDRHIISICEHLVNLTTQRSNAPKYHSKTTTRASCRNRAHFTVNCHLKAFSGTSLSKCRGCDWPVDLLFAIFLPGVAMMQSLESDTTK